MKRLLLHARKIILIIILFSFIYQPDSLADSVKDGTMHDLKSAQVMDRVILAVLDDYYDSTRMKPLEMFKASLLAVENSVAEIMVNYSDTAADITVFKSTINIPFSQVQSPWGLSLAFHKIFKFIQKNLPKDPAPDLRMIEYAAVNGLLSTLDPHTSAMTPDLWNELQMSTRGAFEGIGIRITTDYRVPCDGDLTVVDVFDGSPAQKAGLKIGDKFLKIGEDSTVNITTSEAADLLRGKPDTAVNVTIKRTDGSVKKMDIVRQRISIKSVTFNMMKDDIGYIKLDAFQQSSSEEMGDALEELHKKGMKALLLDLRDNPGGLLSSAIEIADMFISNGTLVTTAGREKNDRDVTNAHSEDTEPFYPMVVLINAYSASAAEILSGALRNHGRAVLVGDRSFGKGSVQNIIGLPDGGAMRMTIQQYLLPGDMSIQAVGVTPDIYFKPRTADKKELIISDKKREYSEAALDAHLIRASNFERADRSGSLNMPYFVPSKELKKDLEMLKRCYPENEDAKPYKSRYEVEFARELLQASGSSLSGNGSLLEIMKTVSSFVEAKSESEYSSLKAALKKLKLDWEIGENSPKSAVEPEKMIIDKNLTASVKITGKPAAGKKIYINVTVNNNSESPVYRLRAVTKSDNPYLDGLELAFGKVDSKKSSQWKTEVELSPVIYSRVDPVEISFFSYDGRVPAPVSTDVDLEGRVKPNLIYGWRLEDLGNGNGFVEPGESFKMYVNIKNEGDGKTFKTAVNLSADGIDVESGHFEMKPLKKGESANGEFIIKIPSQSVKKHLEVNLDFEEWVPLKIPALILLEHQKLQIDISHKKEKATLATGAVAVNSDDSVEVFNAPDKKSRVIAYCKNGDTFEIIQRYGDFFEIKDTAGFKGWILSSKTVPGANPKTGLSLIWYREPLITLESPISVIVNTAEYKLSGKVTNENGIKDILVYAGDKKIAYKFLEEGTAEYSFSFNISLEEGKNNITVVARQDSYVISAKSIFVRRTK
ncbi:MAG: PDZ domain-containing protein [Deltaproteobacteria bacterium]|nr:PDZ domain-containing protein [Deltaproteobacteria bacterium]